MSGIMFITDKRRWGRNCGERDMGEPGLTLQLNCFVFILKDVPRTLLVAMELASFSWRSPLKLFMVEKCACGKLPR